MSKFYNTLLRVIPVLYVLLPDLLVRLRGRETTIGCMEWPLPRTPSWVSWHSLSQDSIALSILAAGVADLSLCNKPTPVNSTSERQERLLYDSNNAHSMYIVVRNLKTMRSNFLTPVTPFSFTQNKQGHVYIHRF